MRVLKTYEIYVISLGVKSLILRTTKKQDVVKKYTALVNAGSRPRVSIDGEQLPIYKAEREFNKNSAGRRKA